MELTETQAKAGCQIETWHYMGKRASRKNTLLFMFEDQTGRRLAFSAVRNVNVIGGEYEVVTQRTVKGMADESEASVTMWSNPEWTGARHPVTDRVLDWEREDAQARQDVERVRREKDEGKRTELSLALDPIVKIAKRCRTRAEREALIATVVGEILRAGAW